MSEIELLVDRYLSGAMSKGESNNFEMRLKQDSKLVEEYEKSKMAYQLVVEAGRLKLKKDLELFEEENDDQTEKKQIVSLWMRRCAKVAAVAIIVFGTYTLMFSDSITSTEVYDAYFEVYDAPSANRDVEATTNVNWLLAIDAYNKKDYENAISLFERDETKPKYLTRFYMGMSHLLKENPNYKESLTHFDFVTEYESDYYEQAIWYKSLILLKIKKRKEALRILEEIKKNGTYNAEKAKMILGLEISD